MRDQPQGRRGVHRRGSAQITLDFIMDERARELAGESNRWQDLIRPNATYFVDA